MKRLANLILTFNSFILIAQNSSNTDTIIAGFDNFLVTQNGDGSCTEIAPCQGSQDWSGFPTILAADRQNQTTAGGDGKPWFIHAGGAGNNFSSFVDSVIGENGWDYLANDVFEFRWTWEDDNYAYSAYNNKGALLRVGFEAWNVTKGYRLIAWINDVDGNDKFALIPTDHPGSGGSNDPQTDWVYLQLPMNWETAGNSNKDDETGYNEWLAASKAVGGGQVNADGTYINGDYAGSTAGEIIGPLIWFVWNLDDVSDGTIDAYAGEGGMNTGMEKNTVVEITLGPPRMWGGNVELSILEGDLSGDSLFIGPDNLLDMVVIDIDKPMTNTNERPDTLDLFVDGEHYRSFDVDSISGNPEDTLTYQYFIDNWPLMFQMLPNKVFTFNLKAFFDGASRSIETFRVFVNRYEYLSIAAEGVPLEFALHDNYPNPFNPTTTLRFDLPEVSDITLTIYNMLGQKVRTFDYQNTSAGYHSITWDATNDLNQQVGAGVYLYQLQAKDFVKTRKMVLLK